VTVTPNNDAAIDFLRLYAPEGPWVLTAIDPGRKGIDTRTFRPSTEADCRSWLERHGGRWNLYFHVNPPTHDMDKKAEREDIRELAWLHVDIDPRAGEDIQEEQDRALALLTTKLPAGVPPPTVVVFSGGGYQGFWRLTEPFAIGGDLGRAEEAKRWNLQLEVLFGADNCHNVDRIMRLPGTVNVPDARKQRKGRVPVLARLVEFVPERTYDLGQFTAAPVVQMPGGLGFSAGRGAAPVQVSGNVPRLSDVSELDQWNVPDRVKVVLVQGRHPEERKQGDDSRSAWLFDACCQLVRCEVPDEVVFSILTDPDFGISESVLEKGANAERYAIRQIERAKEEAIDPQLRKLNEQFAVIGNIGGKCRVVEEVMDPALKRTRLTRQSFDDFRNRFMHIKVQTGINQQGAPVLVPAGKWWLEHPRRRQYETIVFAPGQELADSYNLWRGFACSGRPGDCNLFLAHLRDNVCSGKDEYYEYLLSWMARAVQQPDTPGEVAVVLRGGRGTGKSLAAKVFGSLFGRHFLQVSNPSHLVGNFNAHLRDVVVLFADEAFFAGDKRHSSILKTLITEETLQIEAKGVDVETSPNYVHLIMASNDQHVVPAGGDERRFFVLEVGNSKQQDASYFGAIMKQMQEGGREALLHLLLTRSLDSFQVRNVPQTEALTAQKELSMSPMEEWWFQKLQEGRSLRRLDAWECDVRKDELVDDFVQHTQRFNVHHRGNATVLGRFLKEICGSRLRVDQRMASWDVQSPDGYMVKCPPRRTYFWVLPTLADCRAKWDELRRINTDWPEPVPEQAPLPVGRGRPAF